MKNSNAIIDIMMACVWCGIAFLRSLVELFQPEREMGKYEYVLSAKSERWEVRFLPSAHFFNDILYYIPYTSYVSQAIVCRNSISFSVIVGSFTYIAPTGVSSHRNAKNVQQAR